MHSMSNFVVDDGSVMKGTVENIGHKSRQRPKQNNRTPIVVESGSVDQNVRTVESIRNGAVEPPSIRQMNNVNISPGAKFVNRDMGTDEFLEYFCERKT
ncbi:hypothetical protein HAV15_005964 [Penicillium sp. str. |nr:hypothetical protein HAV15_005964 [Penicillium sp. str. \